MNSGKIVAGGRTDGWTEIEGSIRGPRGPKKGAIVEWEKVHMTYFYKRHSLVNESNYPCIKSKRLNIVSQNAHLTDKVVKSYLGRSHKARRF